MDDNKEKFEKEVAKLVKLCKVCIKDDSLNKLFSSKKDMGLFRKTLNNLKSSLGKLL